MNVSEIYAALAAIDAALDAGRITLEDYRGMLADRLLELVRAADKSPEGRAMLVEQRKRAMLAINGKDESLKDLDVDYADRAYGCMVVLVIDQVQAGRKAQGRGRYEHQEHEFARARLASICAATDLACVLLEAYAWPGDDVSTADTFNHREAWDRASKAGIKARELQSRIGAKVTPRVDQSFVPRHVTGNGGAS
ncbi:hypothetical protein [Solilutibacter silvestris]|uniref:Uncharacterized protein n=1 Tax=Solilutibacter silvestris TaxID=1645665 RepID=A0A2K1PYI2_9GAMM|nr:hypothetical protein [Lysobacter silvestris]PNS07833.1 hypothetical protein Lysil_2009 [Lysobacter silvestris]